MLRRSTSQKTAATDASLRYVIVGLGNPGKKFEHTRHNVGADAVHLLVSRVPAKLRAGRDRAMVAETHLNGAPVILAVPTTYMNDSGHAVGALARRYKVDDPARIVIVHDELDLEPGVVRVKVGGGLAGHNGLKSVSAHLHSDEYVRVRIGVGKPRTREQGADHVLSTVSAAERRILDIALETAADAVRLIVAESAAAAMQEFNSR